MCKSKFVEWIGILILCAGTIAGYGKLNNQVENNSKYIDKFETKIDKIADDVAFIKGKLE